jgi:hypothetical protein
MVGIGRSVCGSCGKGEIWEREVVWRLLLDDHLFAELLGFLGV